MRAAAVPSLQRADKPWEPNITRGFFTYARTHLSGLSLHFWVLMIYLFFALSYLDEHFPALESLRPRSLLGAFALLVAVGRSLQEGIKRGKPLAIERSQSFWLMGFVFICALSYLFAFEVATAKQPFIDHTTTIIGYFLLINIVRTRREFLLTILVVCAGVGTFLVFSLHEWFGGRYDYAQGVVRMMGIGVSNADPNSFGATIVMTFPLIIWVGMFSRSWFVRFCAVAYAAMAFYAVLKTSSRSALVLTVCTCLWGVTMIRSVTAKIIAVSVLVVVGIVITAAMSPAQKTRIASIVKGDTYTKDMSTADRVEGYSVGWRIMTQNPFLGVGSGNWSSYRMRKDDGSRLMPHNLTGQILATHGLLGTFMFLAFVISCIRFAFLEWRRRRKLGTNWDRAVGALCCTVILCFGLLFISGLAAHNMCRANWYWMPALMLVAASCRNEDWLELQRTAT